MNGLVLELSAVGRVGVGRVVDGCGGAYAFLLLVLGCSPVVEGVLEVAGVEGEGVRGLCAVALAGEIGLSV